MNKFYYADYTPLTDTFFAGAVTNFAPVDIDMSGIGTNDRCQTWAMTFRVGADWVTQPSRMYQGCFRMYQNFDQGGQAVHLNQGAWQHMGLLNFGFTSDYFLGIQFTPEEFAPYRNRWLGLVSATSDTTSDFAGWYSGDKIKHNYFVRNVLVDLETQRVIKKSDRCAYNIKAPIDLSRPWQIANNVQTAGPGQYYNSSFLLLGARNHNQDLDEIKLTNNQTHYQCLSTWTAMGSALDPVRYWPQLTGTGIATQIESVRAWNSWQFTDSGLWFDDTYMGSTIYKPPLTTKNTTRWPDSIGWTIFSRKRSDPDQPVYQPYVD